MRNPTHAPFFSNPLLILFPPSSPLLFTPPPCCFPKCNPYYYNPCGDDKLVGDICKTCDPDDTWCREPRVAHACKTIAGATAVAGAATEMYCAMEDMGPAPPTTGPTTGKCPATTPMRCTDGGCAVSAAMCTTGGMPGGGDGTVPGTGGGTSGTPTVTGGPTMPTTPAADFNDCLRKKVGEACKTCDPANKWCQNGGVNKDTTKLNACKKSQIPVGDG